MTIDKLLANFERLAEAPNGIPKLREMILQLAVRGKLVPQDPNDELASELLKRIRAEKQRLIADGQVPKPRSSRSAEEASVEPPFAVPEGWNWSTLDAISSYIQRGKGPKYVEESSIPVVSQKCVQWRGFTMEPARFIDPDSLDKYGPERFLRTGDLLWNSTGTGTIGRINVYHHQAHGFERVVADSHLTVVRPVDVSSEFIRTFLASPDVQDGFEDRASGSTNQIELSTAAVRAQEIPVPPLAEQKRIVAKVEQLMTLCDDLEAKRQAKLTKQIALNRASLHVLTKPNGTSLATAWHRVRDHFDDLYTVPETVAELRKSILQLAVMGRLVPQDPNDEPASELLKKIQAEKQRLIKEGKIRKQKCLPPVESDEMPSKLPGCWLWTRLDELIVAGPKNGYSPKPVDFETPVKTLTLSAVTRGTFNESCFKYVDLEADAVEKYWLEDGDLLVQRSNTPEYVGVSAVYRGPKKQFMFPDLIVRVRLTESVWLEYVHLAMLGQAARGFLRERASGTSSTMVKINQTSLRMAPIPLPPLGEQERIVAKVGQLMPLCDSLEVKLQQAQTDAGHLLTAIVQKLTAA